MTEAIGRANPEDVSDLELARVRKAYRDYERVDQEAAVHRLELGRALLAIRPRWPKRGRGAKPWGDFLRAEGINEDVALDAMNYAEFVNANPCPAGNKLPTLREAGIGVPQPKDDADGVDRDKWCSPEWFTKAIGKVTLDPCSNEWSTVIATKTYSLDAGQDGLLLPWSGRVYVNGPYSALMPWAEKLDRERKKISAAGFMVNTAGDTEWWQLLVKHLPLRLDFDERIEFKPPPGVEPSSNDRPQTLLMDAAFWKKCNTKALLERGTLWERRTR